MPRYLCSIPDVKGSGRIPEIISDDPDAIAMFKKTWDLPGRSVYECVSTLKPGATRRSLETIEQLRFIHVDIDLRSLTTPQAEVLRKLAGLPLPLEIRESGGGYHVVAQLKDPPLAGTPELEQANRVRKHLTRVLCGDPAPDHSAALLRAVDTHNFKYGEPRLCHVIQPGEPLDITEVEDLLDLLVDNLLFEPLPKPTANGHDHSAADNNGERKTPVDIDARLDAMRWHGPGDSAINITTRDVMASQLRRGIALDVAAEVMLAAIKRCVAGHPDASTINWRHQELEVLWSGARLINKEPELVDRLPDPLHTKFVELDRAGRRPVVCKNNHRLYVRPSRPEEGAETAPKGDGAEQPKQRQKPELFVIQRFTPFDPATLPQRQWLYGRHYLRRTVSATIAPGGYGKSTLDLVEAIAMATARDLLGEQPTERLRVWYHNGEDPLEEIRRRVAAVCQHYGIDQQELVDWFFMTSGNEVPLRVAEGYTNLDIKAELIAHVNDQVARNGIDVAILDPLITLHGVPESDNPKMYQVIRIFSGIADACDCAIEISHHVRKGPPGSNGDFSAADMRGASSIHDAVRAARILNRMSEKDARDLSLQDHDRIAHFRIDPAKGNYSPASKALWRKFMNITLPNGDDVGVVIPWDYPGQGAVTPERAEAEQTAEYVFLQLLDRLTLEGRMVSDKVGRNYAPVAFADEPEAKVAKLSKVALKGAMLRLFKAGKIRSEEGTSRGKRVHQIVRT